MEKEAVTFMKRDADPNGSETKERVAGEPFLSVGTVLFLCLFGVLTWISCSTRFFNFDEFQVLYESAALVRGKTLYADAVARHFPFLNILLSWLISVVGFEAHSLLVARIFVALWASLCLVFVYKIAGLLWQDRLAGMLSVLLALSTMIFFRKGIEIRHDVFSMCFVTIGVFYGLKSLDRKAVGYLVTCGLLLGLAVASTQKAVVWTGAVLLIFGISLVRVRGPRAAVLDLLWVMGAFAVPLVLCILYLLLVSGETLNAFLATATETLNYFRPGRWGYPFPFRKTTVIGRLLYANGLLYALSIPAIMVFLRKWLTRSDPVGLVTAWALIGLLFYLLNARPFPQTLLPTIPALGILVAGWLTELWARYAVPGRWKPTLIAGFVCLGLVVWPAYRTANLVLKDEGMGHQLENVSFCLQHLQSGDSVLCFTQQQIFFDPVFNMARESRCGRWIYELDADCVEQEMMRTRCKVVINDYRTTLLSNSVKKKLVHHFLRTKSGDVWIPGFLLPPGKAVERHVWVPGEYYSPTKEVRINGTRAGSYKIPLEQKKYILENPTDRRVYLVYRFSERSELPKAVAEKDILRPDEQKAGVSP